MPSAVAKFTVTGVADAADSVAVKVACPGAAALPSAKVASATASVGIGDAASSSTMVAVPVARVSVAPTALLSTTAKCSFASLSSSAVIGMEIVLVCSPTAKVTEPDRAVKSEPPASPATVLKSTVTVSVAGLDKVRTKTASLPVAPVPPPLPKSNSIGVR